MTKETAIAKMEELTQKGYHVQLAAQSTGVPTKVAAGGDVNRVIDVTAPVEYQLTIQAPPAIDGGEEKIDAETLETLAKAGLCIAHPQVVVK
ncbi:MAG: hypothetical protein M3355_12160 [Actinomycetota bacterium]|nr:hypothetical protein [Actinomycetota bacterium]